MVMFGSYASLPSCVHYSTHISGCFLSLPEQLAWKPRRSPATIGRRSGSNLCIAEEEFAGACLDANLGIYGIWGDFNFTQFTQFSSGCFLWYHVVSNVSRATHHHWEAQKVDSLLSTTWETWKITTVFGECLVMMGRLLGRAYMLPHSFDSCSKTGMMIMLFHLMGIATLSLDTPRFSKTATSGSSLSTRVLPILISTWQPKKPCRGHHQLLCRLRDNGIETIQISVILCSGALAGSIP